MFQKHRFEVFHHIQFRMNWLGGKPLEIHYFIFVHRTWQKTPKLLQMTGFIASIDMVIFPLQTARIFTVPFGENVDNSHYNQNVVQFSPIALGSQFAEHKVLMSQESSTFLREERRLCPLLIWIHRSIEAKNVEVRKFIIYIVVHNLKYSCQRIQYIDLSMILKPSLR